MAPVSKSSTIGVAADLSQVLLELVHPHQPGDEIAPGVRLAHTSTEVGLRLGLLVDDEPIAIEVARATDGPFAARAGQFAFSYRTEGDRNRVADRGLELCRLVAAIAQTNVDRFEQGLRDAAIGDAPKIRSVSVASALERAGSAAQPFYTLTPYVGCLIGCRFCYAQERLASMRELLQLPQVPWGSYVDVRRNIADVLAAELDSLPTRPIKFCPIVSDPYHAVEKAEQLTRQCLEVIAPSAWPTLVLTRSALVMRDVDLLSRMESLWVGVSLPTVDDDVRAHFEPRGASVSERVEVLRTLRDRGIRTFAMVQPLLPGSMAALVDTLADTVTSVSLDVLRGEGDAAAQFDDPQFAMSRTDSWQRQRADELEELLRNRGVALWSGELPAELHGAD